MHNRRIIAALIVILTAALFAGAGNLVARAYRAAETEARLAELADIALRRAESAVSYAGETLDALADTAVLDCSPASLQRVRLSVYRRGAIKDIRLVRPDMTILCSAFAETLEFDHGWVSPGDLVPAPGQRGLFLVNQFFGKALGVYRAIPAAPDNRTAAGIVAIVGIDGAMFDVLPRVLDNHARMVVRLDNGTELFAGGHLGADAAGTGVARRALKLPLTVNIDTDVGAVGLSAPIVMPVTLVCSLLGFVFGVMAARPWMRPPDPLDEIDRALAAGEFKPWFQPIVDMSTGRFVGAEVLARWEKPDGTVLAPGRFIDLMEAHGRIPALTWSLIEQSLALLRPRMTGGLPFKLSFNAAPSHFVASEFAPRLLDLVRLSGADPSRVTVEITEREPFDDVDAANGVIAALHEAGCKVAIDDVGIGHSGLSQIQRLDADILKIDKFFVDSVKQSASTLILVEMLVRLAHERGMSVVAEGIEDDDQAVILAQAGVGFGQGYVYARPMPAPAFLARLTESDLRLAASGSQQSGRATRHPDALRCAG